MNTSTIIKLLCFLQNEEGKPCVLPVVLDVEQEMVKKASNIQGESKKRVISKNMAITTLKSIRKGKSWCVLENSA